MSEINTTTGNPDVDKVSSIMKQSPGNIIPQKWYKTVLRNGKPYYEAILVLAEIVYGFRSSNPDHPKSEEQGLRKSYKELAKKINTTVYSVRTACSFLEDIGLIKREFRDYEVDGRILNNTMYLRILPESLKRITIDEDKSKETFHEIKGETTCETKESLHEVKRRGICAAKESPYEIEGESPLNSNNKKTNIKTNIKNNKKTKQECFGDDANSLFAEFDFDAKTIGSIIDASEEDLGKCRAAISLLRQQKAHIANPAGWLIAAIKNGYTPPTGSRDKYDSRYSFFKYPQRDDYDFLSLEKKLLKN